MKKRNAFIGVILSLIPFGQISLIKTGLLLSNAGLTLSSQKVNAESSDFYFGRGYEKGEIGDHNGAIADFTKVIELKPNNSKAFYNRGWNKDSLKDYYGAISDYTKAIELNPKYSIAYFNRGLLKRKLNDFDGAIFDYTKAIEFNPRDYEAYNNRGIAKKKRRIFMEQYLITQKQLNLIQNI